ncbi:MAG: electron transport complex subunit RsxB [Cardiobacteriaceae bacterium]|nr:electron transport complex subunit RsxB [Cardiobacteriaceae bacterium]
MYYLLGFIFLLLLIGFLGLLLGFSAQKFSTESGENPLIAQINDILPQSQCGQCGFVGCKPYAVAVVEGQAAINLCPPGGREVVEKIAEIMQVPVPDMSDIPETVEDKIAFIVEEWCIGCAKCARVCPVDAIVGSQRHIHTVMTDFCTGCDLCPNTCPTNCIKMLPTKIASWKRLEIAKQLDE